MQRNHHRIDSDVDGLSRSVQCERAIFSREVADVQIGGRLLAD